jgi:uncharacterized protein YaaN involved in tellurite resistance
VFEQASSATVSIDTLKQAFADTTAAIDSVSAYKEKALASFQASVAALQPMIEQSKKYISEHRDGAAGEVAQLDAGAGSAGSDPTIARIV